MVLDNAWSEVTKDLNDLEYEPTDDWNAVFSYYDGQGWMTSIRLVDGIDSVLVTTDDADPQLSRHVTFDVGFLTGNGPVVHTVSATIGLHRPPV